MDFTLYEMRWHDGLPPDGADREWLGETEDGRRVLLFWDTEDRCWIGASFSKDHTAAEIWMFRGTGLNIIKRHTALSATMIEELPDAGER